MPRCSDDAVESGQVGTRAVEAAFDGGDIVSNGGLSLFKQVDERVGLARAAAPAFLDERRGASVPHSMHALLARRINGLCQGRADV